MKKIAADKNYRITKIDVGGNEPDWHRWPWVYLDGTLEDTYGYDIFTASEPKPTSGGVYDLQTREGDLLKAFLWEDPRIGQLTGLVVFANDEEAVGYAKSKMEKKDSI